MGSSNITCTWNGTSTRYECTVTSESLHYANYIYSVTPIGTTTLLWGTNSLSGTLWINFYNLSGTQVQAPYGFSLVIFKP